VARGLRIH